MGHEIILDRPSSIIHMKSRISHNGLLGQDYCPSDSIIKSIDNIKLALLKMKQMKIFN